MTARTIALLMIGFAWVSACGGDDDDGAPPPSGAAGQSGSPEQTGAVCDAPTDCYPELDQATLKGAVQCLDRVRNGYCTHLCETDADCCAVPGECKTGIKQVCSPFESTGQKMCFLSCESEDLVGTDDDSDYCQREASYDFICRSSGGGSENRKVCVPSDCGIGAACTDNTQCDADQTCATNFLGGYCTKQGCTANADCPNDSRCVTVGGANVCLKTCADNTDCSFCRSGDGSATCRADATFVEAGDGSVCIPTPR